MAQARSTLPAMTLTWIKEQRPTWDAPKMRIVGEAPAGIFDVHYRQLVQGALVPGDWWRVEDGGQILGYGWLDVVWGDAEILVAVDPSARKKGVGAFILDRLEDEARARGLNVLYNIVRPTHPDRDQVSAWFQSRGFRAAEDGSLQRAVPRK
jgi:N-acetylglutamate synthase-like GNAT family acetyltransferase